MNKSVKCAVLSVLMVCCMVFSLPLTAFAAESYQMNINEPAIGDNQGYILLLVQGSSGAKQVHCISWTLNASFIASDATYNTSEMEIFISNSDKTVLFTGFSSDNDSISCGFGRSLSGDSKRTLYWTDYDDSDSPLIYYGYSLSSNTVLGYQVYGNGIVYSHDLGDNNNTPFSVTWGDDAQSVSLMTKMLAELTSMSDDVGTLITQIYEIIANDEEALVMFNDILVELVDQGLTIDEIKYKLSQIFNYVASINDKLSYVRSYLKDILEILQAQGESTFEEPDTSSIDDYNKAEGELVDGAEDTSDIEEEIGNFEIDVNASNSIWDIINRFLNAHPKVFGLAIGMLCLGIIALILNR